MWYRSVKETAMEDDGGIWSLEEARFCVDYLSESVTADGLDLDGERIIEKSQMQEVET